MNAKVTAPEEASLALSWRAANARDQVHVAGSPKLTPFASIGSETLPADGRAVLVSQFNCSRPCRENHRRVDAELFDRYLHALDAAGCQGQAGDCLCQLGGHMGTGGTGKMFAGPECCRTDSEIIGRIG